jgi:hypothetical protein
MQDERRTVGVAPVSAMHSRRERERGARHRPIAQERRHATRNDVGTPDHRVYLPE